MNKTGNLITILVFCLVSCSSKSNFQRNTSDNFCQVMNTVIKDYPKNFQSLKNTRIEASSLRQWQSIVKLNDFQNTFISETSSGKPLWTTSMDIADEYSKAYKYYTALMDKLDCIIIDDKQQEIISDRLKYKATPSDNVFKLKTPPAGYEGLRIRFLIFQQKGLEHLATISVDVQDESGLTY